MNPEDFDDLQSRYKELMDLYMDIKRDIKCANTRLFERWKAGGFCIDPDIMSMYPDLGKVIEKL